MEASKTRARAPADCDSDPNSISAARAHQIIRQTISPLAHRESVATRSALGRVAAVDIKSPTQVPNHTNSAMDGYALRAQDLAATGATQLHVLGAAFAGNPFRGEVRAGQCVRIMTGAVLPAGADRVVMQERVERVGEVITVPGGEPAAANVRRAGEDLQVGEVAIAAGRRLAAAHLGLAASLGLAELPVMRRPRVAFFSNGDELRAVGKPLASGEVYDSNRYTLYGMLRAAGVEMVDFGIVADDADALSATLEQAAACADMVITSAGASVGEADYIAQIMRQIGDLKFCKVAMKPGRPMAFGALRESLFFGLPGNPVSVMATFHIFVKPALRLLSGETAAAPLRLQAKTVSALKKRAGRTEYQRGILTNAAADPHNRDAPGATTTTMAVRSTGEQGSGMLRSMGEANCFIVLPAESADVAAGEIVEVQPFAGLW